MRNELSVELKVLLVAVLDEFLTQSENYIGEVLQEINLNSTESVINIEDLLRERRIALMLKTFAVTNNEDDLPHARSVEIRRLLQAVFELSDKKISPSDQVMMTEYCIV